MMRDFSFVSSLSPEAATKTIAACDFVPGGDKAASGKVRSSFCAGLLTVRPLHQTDETRLGNTQVHHHGVLGFGDGDVAGRVADGQAEEDLRRHGGWHTPVVK